MPEYSDDQIREYAHKLWENEGKPDGKADEFWHRAKKELEKPDAENPKPLPE